MDHGSGGHALGWRRLTPGIAALSRAHAESERLARRIDVHLTLTEADADGGPVPEHLDDLRACLYGLHTVLRLHFTQEEENYFSLAPEPAYATRALPVRWDTTHSWGTTATGQPT